MDEIYDFDYDDKLGDGKELPECPWYHGETGEKPLEPKEWIDKVAEEVELKRLTKMEVIRGAMDGAKDGIQKTLTTRFVFDWRLEPFKDENGTEVMKWMRRARLVAREFAFAEGKLDDVFGPASSSPLLRLLPVLYLHKPGQYKLAGLNNGNPYTFGCLDVKDAFLQVPH